MIDSNTITGSAIDAIKKSHILTFLYEKIWMNIFHYLSKLSIMNSVKYIKMISIVFFICSSILLFASLYIFYPTIMIIVTLLKVLNLSLEQHGIQNTTTSTNSNSAMEHIIIMIFFVLLMPLTYIPWLGFFIKCMYILLSFVSLANNVYRHKIYTFIVHTILSDNKYSELYGIFKLIYIVINCLIMSLFNMIENPRKMYNKINNICNDDINVPHSARKKIIKIIELLCASYETGDYSKDNCSDDELDEDL